MAKGCGCATSCPCQSGRVRRRRRNHRMNAFPKTNPIHDLLSFLIAEKYKEPLNKPTIVKPEVVSTGTSTEAVSTEPETKPSPAISRFSESLATLEKSRRLSIDSVSSSATSDPSMTETQGEPAKSKPKVIRLSAQQRGLHKPTTGPVANILSTLQEIPEQEAGGIGNVDFQ